MKTQRFCSLICLIGCLGCTAVADEASSSLTRQLLDSYSYQPDVMAVPPTSSQPLAFNPVVTPSFLAAPTEDRIYDDLLPIFTAQDAQHADALYVWNLTQGNQLLVVGTPKFQELDVLWSPMTVPTAYSFSPSSLNNSTAKLQARFPLLTFNW